MVPRKVGDDLLRRRLSMRMTQTQIAEVIGTSRAYVSAVERGVDWDPDADKLTKWASTLGWEPEHILQQLSRPTLPRVAPVLTPELLDVITRAVAQGVREGIEEALSALARDPSLQARS